MLVFEYEDKRSSDVVYHGLQIELCGHTLVQSGVFHRREKTSIRYFIACVRVQLSS